MEILVALAYQVYTLGLSLDQACQVLGFFPGLTLIRKQMPKADRMTVYYRAIRPWHGVATRGRRIFA